MSRRITLVYCLILAGIAVGGACPVACAAPQNSPAPYQDELERARELLRIGKVDEAIKAFKHASKLANDSSAECYLGLAEAYWKLRAFKNVVESCDRVLRLSPDKLLAAQAHNQKGVALSAEGDKNPEKHKEAEAEFRAALELAPNLHFAHFNLGVELLKQGRDPEGLGQIKLYLERAPQGGSAAEARQFLANPRRARENFVPDFSFTSLQGEYISSDDLTGKVVLLDFWATWCRPCVEALPELKRLYKRLDKERFVVLSISADTDEQAWREFVAKNKMDWPQYFDRDRKLGKMFGVQPIPTYFVIDGEGIIRRQITGWGGNRDVILENEIRKWLKQLAPR